ncbi:hypothetical protein B0H16DRAFT_1336247 [Mycena metata]|uniref:Zn(2)-C6 fungal-type domain-containing protein n=1 Tax=Mycena metata TaxID=1033252 RepID=A0AAD7HGV2_9AGAR|nr:hypothetical protein B0H16DRAFT_1336247 [Mycena metata]
MPPSAESNPLQRGKACFSCRRRKMRCDGILPVCGQCSRAGRDEDCEYTNGQKRARVEMLQESISQVESRISELENPATQNQETGLVLREPYQPGPTSTSPDEPPRDVIQKLVDAFLAYSSEVGFFLNASRFRTSALRRHPLGHHARPAPALLASVYLWGLRLSNQPQMGSQEALFLARALGLTVKGLSGIHPQRVMHNLQAEVLLAYYFFACGRLLEGKYHSAAAVSLSLSSGLHLTRSANGGTSGALPNVQDAVEEGERIHACWIVMVLDTAWAVALEESPHLNYQQHAYAFDAPWPLEMDDYEKGRLNPTAVYSKTLHNFLNGAPTSNESMSTIAMLVKASVLWQRADSLVREWRPDLSRTELNALEGTFVSLNNLIDRFRGVLIPPNRIADPTPAMIRTLIIAHSLAHTATIQLHTLRRGSNAGSGTKCIAAASTVLNILVSVPLQHLGFLNPIMGTPWLAACRVITDRISALRLQRAVGLAQLEEEKRLVKLLTRAVAVLPSFAQMCPLLSVYTTATSVQLCRLTIEDHQISRIQETFDAIEARKGI